MRNSESASSIINNSNFFPERKRINMNDVDNSPVIMIFNINYETTQIHLFKEELLKQGIVKCEKVTFKSNKEANFVKAYCKDNDTRLNLLKKK